MNDGASGKIDVRMKGLKGTKRLKAIGGYWKGRYKESGSSGCGILVEQWTGVNG